MARRDRNPEYLVTIKMSKSGPLRVPKRFRQDLGLRIGATFAVLRLGDGLILFPEQPRFEQLCEQVSTRLASAGLTPSDLLATLPKARNRVYARHYRR
jgi:hypothetical protein